jgi:hypothetical protein
MKHTVTLTITSLLSMLLTTFHHSDEIVRGWSRKGSTTSFRWGLLLVWLYGT